MKKHLLILALAGLVLSGCQESIGANENTQTDSQPIATSNPNNERTIVLVQKGEKTAEPNLAYINFEISTSDQDLEVGRGEVDNKTIEIKESLKNLGIEEAMLETIYYNISPSYDETGQANGYYISHYMSVKVEEIGKVQDVIDSLSETTALVSNVSFDLDDQRKAELYDEAVKEAIQIAKLRADSIGEAMGVGVKDLIKVNESITSDFLYPMDMAMEAATMSGPITPGETTVRCDLELTFSY